LSAVVKAKLKCGIGVRSAAVVLKAWTPSASALALSVRAKSSAAVAPFAAGHRDGGLSIWLEAVPEADARWRSGVSIAVGAIAHMRAIALQCVGTEPILQSGPSRVLRQAT